MDPGIVGSKGMSLEQILEKPSLYSVTFLGKKEFVTVGENVSFVLMTTGPKNRILDLFKLKTHAEDKMDMSEKN